MSGKRFILFFISLLFLFSSVAVKSQEGDSLYYRNTDLFIAKALFNKKIVMLGDNGHHQPGVYHYLLGTLYKWLELCQSSTEEVNLTLIIENEEPMSTEINNYINDGDMPALVEKINPEFYLEDLEYFTNLRYFSRRIDSLNLHRNKKISFIVKAFEQVGSINTGRVDGLTQREHELWFVNERDSVTADGIIDYVNSNPDEQILIFYGGAHLFNKEVDKIGMGRLEMLTPEEGRGYFLAYYLEKEFGAENVIKFNPWGSSLYKYAQKKDFPYPGRKNFIAKGIDLGIADTLILGADYIYHIQFEYLPFIEGNKICSKLILNKTIEQINNLKTWLPGHIAKRYYYYYMYNITLLTGVYDTSLYKSTIMNDFDEIDWLYNDKLGDTLLAQISRIPKDNFQEVLRNYFGGLLSDYGISFWAADTSKKYSEKDDWIIHNFPELMNKIKFTNSIGIYWFGYPDEKIKAKEYLVKFSGQDYAEPEKYLQWYRMKYYGYEY